MKFVISYVRTARTEQIANGKVFHGAQIKEAMELPNSIILWLEGTVAQYLDAVDDVAIDRDMITIKHVS